MLMHDAGSNFDALFAIVYADDTLLLATSDGHVQEFLLESPMLKSYTNTANTASLGKVSVILAQCIRTPRGKTSNRPRT